MKIYLHIRKNLKVYVLYTCLGILSAFINACDVLDKEPLDSISDSVVWSDETLIDAIITGAYVSTTVFQNEADDVANTSALWFHIYYINNISDESKSLANWQGTVYNFRRDGININGGAMEYWERPYKIIRNLNDLLERLPNANVRETFKVQKAAEARFLRAFNYFYMVKRYGGIPLITKVQHENDPEDELYPSRNKEQEVYDFIISEAKAISEVLPETVSDADWGRPSKYAALALASRAALYAGSIAEYGTVQLNGVVGIENSLANHYYQESYNASRQIMDSGLYRLYNANRNKTQNFRDIFMVKRNAEVIFATQHDGSDKDTGGAGWCYDYFQCPYPNGWSSGNHDAPYLETVEAFENIDGTPGTVDFDALQGKLLTIQELWGNKDPRFFATVYTQDTQWQGRTLNFYNGIRTESGRIVTTGSYKGILANGEQNVWETGFGVLKYLDESKDNGNGTAAGIFGSSQDFIIFRYAEILLNYAEAAYALGKSAEALTAINQIRSRAGIAQLATIDVDKIRHERRVELAFEGHRYWDLRRWRVAVDYLSRDMSGIRFILDYATRKFMIEKRYKIDGSVNPPIFREENYYLPITPARTNSNPNLVENPGYR